MKKQYEIPLLEWVRLDPSDIITQSDNDANFQDCWLPGLLGKLNL